MNRFELNQGNQRNLGGGVTAGVSPSVVAANTSANTKAGNTTESDVLNTLPAEYRKLVGMYMQKTGEMDQMRRSQ